MKSIRTVQDLIDALGVELDLEWNGEGGTNTILDVREGQLVGTPAGPLNLIRPNQIQVIGPPEQAHLLSGMAENYRHCLEQLFAQPPAALLFTNGRMPEQSARMQDRHHHHRQPG